MGDRLEELRETLNCEIEKNMDCLVSKDIVELSQELDKEIVTVQREKEDKYK